MRIECQNICFYYDTNCILKDFNAIFPSQKITYISGDNGVGKTTLLKLIAGLHQPYTGHILYDNKKFYNKNISYVPQKSMFFKRSINQYCKWLHISNKDQWLHYAHLHHYADHYPEQLSGGQQQRFSIMLALSFSAPILLLDEPYNNLDNWSKEWLSTILIEQKHKTIIIVSHDDITPFFNNIHHLHLS